MSQTRTALRACWETPELIAIIVDLLDTTSQARCARVSRTISEHALNALYRNVKQLVPIFSLLCPLREDFRADSGGMVRVLQSQSQLSQDQSIMLEICRLAQFHVLEQIQSVSL